MRAKDFIIENDGGITISVPVNITIPANGSGVQVAAPKGKVKPKQPVFVPPLQQQLELQKQQGGKSSKVINQILDDNGAASEESELSDEDRIRERLLALLAKLKR
tara:strand:- start:79 stop:393 length:315 start_codon:yes stop_codon:yes gene_type:complete